MTTYKGINGYAVQSVATDPSPSDEGQVWYNNASYAFKYSTLSTAGVWASGGNLNTARSGMAGAGTQTAALGAGGYIGPSTNATELYNGTSWTTNPTGLATARRYLMGCGTQAASLAIGGTVPPAGTSTEEWNTQLLATKTITVS